MGSIGEVFETPVYHGYLPVPPDSRYHALRVVGIWLRICAIPEDRLLKAWESADTVPCFSGKVLRSDLGLSWEVDPARGPLPAWMAAPNGAYHLLADTISYAHHGDGALLEHVHLIRRLVFFGALSALTCAEAKYAMHGSESPLLATEGDQPARRAPYGLDSPWDGYHLLWEPATDWVVWCRQAGDPTPTHIMSSYVAYEGPAVTGIVLVSVDGTHLAFAHTLGLYRVLGELPEILWTPDDRIALAEAIRRGA